MFDILEGVMTNFFPLSVAQQPQNSDAGQQTTYTMSRDIRKRIAVMNSYGKDNSNTEAKGWAHNLAMARVLVCAALKTHPGNWKTRHIGGKWDW